MRDRLYLVPPSLTSALHKPCLVPGTVGECEDEDPVLLPILPAPIKNIPVRKCLVPGPMLFSSFPAPCKDVTIGKEIRSLPIPIVLSKLPDILVTRIRP